MGGSPVTRYDYSPDRRSRPAGHLARRGQARRLRGRRRRGVPLRRRPHRGPAPGVPAPDLVNTVVARLRQPRRRLPAARPARATRHPADGPAQHRRLRHRPAVLDAARSSAPRSSATGSQLRLAGGRRPDESAPTSTAVAARIEDEEGTRPGGWSSPWLTHTPATHRPARRHRLPLPARPAPRRPAGLAAHRQRPAARDPVRARAQRQHVDHRPRRRPPASSPT